MLIWISCRCGSCAGGDQGEEGLDDQANTVSEITSSHVKNLKSITDTFQVLDAIRLKKVKVKKNPQNLTSRCGSASALALCLLP